jgi:hypothetical protein
MPQGPTIRRKQADGAGGDRRPRGQSVLRLPLQERAITEPPHEKQLDG